MLDKKALRKSAHDNPAPAIPAGHGLLHAGQVDHILRTDVRLIGRHRTLVLHIFDRTQAAAGNPVPVWTMFHGNHSYITLVREPDGASRWREASFERLGKDYRFMKKCAFYSARDERRICDFFHDDEHGGIAALIRAQNAILSERGRKRQMKRDETVRKRLECIPALPNGLADWAHRNVMPAYFIYDHSKRGKATGVCSSCGREAVLAGVKHNAEGVCPHCGRKLTMKPRGRIGRLFDRETFSILQRTRTGELAVRIMKATCAYGTDSPGTAVYESARRILRVDPDGTVRCERYYYAHGDGKWRPGDRPVPYPYQYNFEPITYGPVYCGNLPKALAGTPWEYCPIREFSDHGRSPMEMLPFLEAYIEHPRLEHLVKTGFRNLASDLAYGRAGYGLLDEAQHRTHRILQVTPEDVGFLRDMDVDAETLRKFQAYAGVKDRQQLLLWQLEHGVSFNVPQCLEYVTAHKLIRYVDERYPVLQERKGPGWPRCHSVQDIVTEYRDYLDMCARLGYDMKNSFVLFPKDLHAAHDRVQRRVRIRTTAELREDFAAAMKSIAMHPGFEMDGMMIVVPSSPDEIIAEGQALHHCVGTYVDRVAKRESIILFLRMADAPDKSFFTIEVKNRKAVQVRGMQNRDAPPEVRAVVDRFERQVLMAA